MKSRYNAIQDIAGTTFDVCVIGGGATGAGCALDAKLRGFSTVLLEAGDFAGATSCNSTKLVHGGVRYLQQAITDFDLGQYHAVRRALHERKLMLDNAPFLAHALNLLVPCFSLIDICYYGLGMKLYDWISGSKSLSPTHCLSRRESSECMPLLSANKLVGTVEYSDGQFDDARFNMALLRTFTNHGGEAANYVRVVGFGKDSEDRIVEAHVHDLHSAGQFTVRAKAFVNATGPFSDSIRELATRGIEHRLRLSKGVHILFPLSVIEGSDALLVPKTEDGRVIFAIPWLGRLLVGTTDDEADHTDDMTVTREEVEYLLRQLNRYLVRPLAPEEVVSGFAGVRPLVSLKDAQNTKKLIRDHEVEIDNSSGLISILGGKWTTYRAMAEDTINTVQQCMGIPLSVCPTSRFPLSGSDGWTPSYWKALVRQYSVSDGTARHLSEKFGTTAINVLEVAKETPRLLQPIDHEFPAIQAEVVYCIRHEMATTIEDIMARRIGLQLFSWYQARRAAPLVASLLARELEWSRDAEEHAVEQYVDKITHLMDAIGLPATRVMANTRQAKIVNQ